MYLAWLVEKHRVLRWPLQHLSFPFLLLPESEQLGLQGTSVQKPSSCQKLTLSFAPLHELQSLRPVSSSAVWANKGSWTYPKR